MQIVQAEKWLQSQSPLYVIVAIAPDGRRGIPITYKELTLVAYTDIELFEAVKKVEQCRVWELPSQEVDIELLKKTISTRDAQEEERKEREQLAKLLKKYPQ